MENSENSETSKFQAIKNFIQNESNQIIFAILPLFFSWYPVLLYNYENKTVQKYSIYSFVNTLYFLGGLFICSLLAKIPLVGDFIASILHLGVILFYLGISGYLIFSYKKNKSNSLGFLEKHSNYFLNFL
ncbi:MAG: hypothetical protein KDK36_00170 [Leptospiraceae bacterium]|nr:hypothetical protein [Leptospiraceae bacterium]